MKKLSSLLLASMLGVSTFVAQADDASFVANWTLPIFSWFTQPIPTVETTRNQAYADSVDYLDPMNCNFDETWAIVPGSGFAISNAVNNPTFATGPADFTGAFKVLYDEDNMYILLQYTDDDVTGNEGVEIMWAPYLKLDPIAALYPSASLASCSYNRYKAFGAYKAYYDAKGFNAAMQLSFSSSGAGTLDWGSSNEFLVANLKMNDHTATGSNVIKKIFTISYPAFTGDARPDFDPTIWRELNGNKGITFDIKVTDSDAADASAAGYWWNSTHNDGYAVTWYSGFLGPKQNGSASISKTKTDNSIFGNATSDQILLNKVANVVVYNAVGQAVLSLDNVDKINLSNLSKGVFVIKANNETKKIIR